MNRGRYAEAESLLKTAMAGGPDTLVARVRLGDLFALRGQRAEARREYERAVASYTRSRRLSSRELAAVASSLESLGATDPARFRDALRVYDEAIAADSMNWDARVALGDLFLGRNNRPEAVTTYNAVIAAQPDTTSRVNQGFIEKSNVNSVHEMSRMIEITRTYTQISAMLQQQHDLHRTAVEKLADVPA